MLRLDWNDLRPGDRVLVHHDTDAGSRLIAGVVTAVESGSGSNDVAVRVPGADVIHPQRLRVHHDPIEIGAHCWRCADPRAAAPAGRRG